MRHTLKLTAIAVLFTTLGSVQAENMPSTCLDHTSNQRILITTSYLDVSNLSLSTLDPIDKDKAKTIFTKQGEKIYISLNNPLMNIIDIEVRDGLNRIIYTEKIKKTRTILKALNFKKAYKGYYTIYIADGTQTYHKEIAIK